VALTLNIAGTTTFKALLDGVDITSQFSALKNGTTTVSVTEPALNYGINQLQVTAGTKVVNAQFTFNPGAPPTLPGASTATPSPYVSVQTRVLHSGATGTNATDWGVQVGDNNYAASAPTFGCSNDSEGFQVLQLKRTDLSLVSNASYSTDCPQAVQNFLGEISSPNANCGYAGCILVIQSLASTGLNCSNKYQQFDGQEFTPNLCSLYFLRFQSLGASGTVAYANPKSGPNPNVGYSFIGNFGGNYGASKVSTGAYYERLTCAGGYTQGNDCDTLDQFQDKSPLTLPCCTANLTQSAPQGATRDQIGNMSGAFVYDNYHNYTYMQTARQVSFSSVVTPSSNINTITIDNARQYQSSALPPGDATNGKPTNSSTYEPGGVGQLGGFQLFICDASTLAPLVNRTYTIPYVRNLPQGVYNLSQLPHDLAFLVTSRRSLVFLASIGDLQHDYQYGDGSGAMTQNIWDQVAQAIYGLGGTWVTFQQTNQANTPYANELGPMDYTLVGHDSISINASGLTPYYAAEEAAKISAETTKYPVAANMQGILSLDNQGYYNPALYTQYDGLMPSIVSTLTSASALPSTGWPYYGSQGTQGDNNAFNWISAQLCCTNIRAAYSNLNADPEVWLTNLHQLNPSALIQQSGATTPANGFTEAEYSEVEAQLATEFSYLASTRDFQNNIVALYQDQQSNISLILQQAESTILGEIDANNLAVQAQVPQTNVFSVIQDGLNVAGPIADLAGLTEGPVGVITTTQLQASIGIVTDMLSSATRQTNDGDGIPLVEREKTEIATAQLAQNAADDFALSLISLGNTFDRVVSDWNRLKSIGAPLQDNLITWDASASGLLLQSYDVAARRQMFIGLLKANYTIFHYQNSSNDGNQSHSYGDGGCGGGDGSPVVLVNFMTGTPGNQWGFYPNAPVGGPSYATYPPNPNNNPPVYAAKHDLWFDLWFMSSKSNERCPVTGDVSQYSDDTHFFHLFDPLDPSDTSNLGIYKPWLFHRYGFTIVDVNGDSDYFRGIPFAGDTDAF
jgi:hypothetical protein